VVRFAVVIVGLLQFLSDMHTEQSLGAYLVCQADHTFNVEVLGYAFGAFGVVLYRRLAGRWRRSFLPLVYVCYPGERKRAYRMGFEVLKEAM
jgi:hypothetical protein